MQESIRIYRPVFVPDTGWVSPQMYRVKPPVAGMDAESARIDLAHVRRTLQVFEYRITFSMRTSSSVEFLMLQA